MKVSVAPRDVGDELLSRGQYFATAHEIAAMLGVKPDQLGSRLEWATQNNRVRSVTKGGWVPVPPQFRADGAPPPTYYIDAMMRFLGHPYYVGFLSAAALHGASHQSPMIFQVATPARLPARKIGRSRLSFITRTEVDGRPVVTKSLAEGRVQVSSVELTVLDLVDLPRHGAGLSNVATIVGDLLADDLIDTAALAEVARTFPKATLRRTGLLVEHMSDELGLDVDLAPLDAAVDHHEYTPLFAGRSAEGERSERWHVIINDPIEHDL